eukprot:COSAG06_NODE_237_length_19433_cov_92.613961_6_plen_83_part_00
MSSRFFNAASPSELACLACLGRNLEAQPDPWAAARDKAGGRTKSDDDNRGYQDREKGNASLFSTTYWRIGGMEDLVFVFTTL